MNKEQIEKIKLAIECLESHSPIMMNAIDILKDLINENEIQSQ